METLTENDKYVVIRNQGTVSLIDIPTIPYNLFLAEVLSLLESDNNHCVTYYAFPYREKLKFICGIADDSNGDIMILSHEQPLRKGIQLISMVSSCYALHVYEREISENFGVEFINSPWDKPLRYAFNRADRKKTINTYPFYRIHSNELHEVGVGPIHAGVIEPGHFRFLCNGETVLASRNSVGVATPWRRGDLFKKNIVASADSPFRKYRCGYRHWTCNSLRYADRKYG